MPILSRLAPKLPAISRWAALCLATLLCAPALLFTFDLCFGIGQRIPSMPWRQGPSAEQWALVLFAPLALSAWGVFFWLGARWALAIPTHPGWLGVGAACLAGAAACLGPQSFLAIFTTSPAWILAASRFGRHRARCSPRPTSER